jgi:putative DNA primase/helicase
MNLLCQITGKQFAEIAKEIDDILGRSYEKQEAKPRIITPLDRWSRLSPIRGTDAEQYLNSRGIRIMPMRGIKFGYEQVQGKRYGCMYAIAVNGAGEPCYVHQTFLDGTKKAEFPHLPTRKLTTIKQTEDSIAIRLDNSDTILGIAEGIESALSAQQRFKVPTFSTINTAFMKRFKVPAGVETLMIFADSDNNGAGHAAAFECAHKNMVNKKNDLKQVIVRWPRTGDFNDAMGTDIMEWVFKR